MFPMIFSQNGNWFFTVFDSNNPKPVHWSIGRYSSPERAYFAAARYIYGPIPRDFKVGAQDFVAFEGMIERPFS